MKIYPSGLFVVIVGVLVTAGLVFGAHHAVGVAKKDGVGSYLTDIKGMTLYYFKKDSPGKSVCEGPCAQKWPLFYQEKVEAKDGLKAADFDTITRADGKKQTAYKGMPLYYFFKDAKPGDIAGQGVNEVWYVVNP